MIVTAYEGILFCITQMRSLLTKTLLKNQ